MMTFARILSASVSARSGFAAAALAIVTLAAGCSPAPPASPPAEAADPTAEATDPPSEAATRPAEALDPTADTLGDAWTRERGDAAARERLDDLGFRVTRQNGTERAFSSPLDAEKRPGTFACAVCDLALYRSEAKYDSRTGWPSFYQPAAAGRVAERADRSHGMIRTETACARCDSHLGHVFDDGPPPTGRRHCINGVALRFVPDADG